jgi:hypothetical protein
MWRGLCCACSPFLACCKSCELDRKYNGDSFFFQMYKITFKSCAEVHFWNSTAAACCFVTSLDYILSEWNNVSKLAPCYCSAVCYSLQLLRRMDVRSMSVQSGLEWRGNGRFYCFSTRETTEDSMNNGLECVPMSVMKKSDRAWKKIWLICVYERSIAVREKLHFNIIRNGSCENGIFFVGLTIDCATYYNAWCS